MLSSPITPLEGDVEMFQRGKMQPLFAIDTGLANRRIHALSIVPEVPTPRTNTLEVPVVRSAHARPLSEVTQIFEDEEDSSPDDQAYEADEYDDQSLFEEDSESLFEGNESRRSQTTISTFDEIPTPHSIRRTFLTLEARPVEGPKGPHLFRSSTAFDDHVLQLSPLLPKRIPLSLDTTAIGRFSPNGTPTTVTTAITSAPAAVQAPFGAAWDRDEPRTWSAQQVGLWMYNLGIDAAIVEKFQFHDITGTVLLDLQLNDLKELGIQSFGKRHQIWNFICSLRQGHGSLSPVPTPFEDINGSSSCNSTENLHAAQPLRRSPSTTPTAPPKPAEQEPAQPRRRRRKHRRNGDEPIMPADSVSIVAIEQLIPKPHSCPKGEKCHKYKRQQKLLRRLKEEHGFPISPENGGRIFIAGDPGNAGSAPNLVEGARRSADEQLPALAEEAEDAGQSTVGASVVASSDLLGPGEFPAIALHESALKYLEERDPQENVKQFLTLQHIEPPSACPAAEDLDTPVGDYGTRLELFPPQPTLPVAPNPFAQQQHALPARPLTQLHALPRLDIPRASSALSYAQHQSYLQQMAHLHHQQAQFQQQQAALQHQQDLHNHYAPALPPNPYDTFSPCHTALSPDSAFPRTHPAHQPPAATSPPSRGASPITQAVDPRESLRESIYRFGTPASEFDVPVAVTTVPRGPIARETSQSVPPNMTFGDGPRVERVSFVQDRASMSGPTPPVVQRSASRAERRRPSMALPAVAEHEATPVTAQRRGSAATGSSAEAVARLETEGERGEDPRYPGVTHAGWMKKRRTRLLRHEWRSAHFRLRGSELAMHRNDVPGAEAQEVLDVGQYGIACSSIAGGGKLAAKLKALKIATSGESHGTAGKDAAFEFQLVPGEGESGKTHHFAVRSRDERIDWMRELMLARALKAKKDGYEVAHNGNAV
ncbi:hypothetical protein EJ06DRAFT_30894 [Trichodelitschia bisporula]|uniref:SAM and PH domain-containing protein n=1 Tax=Trichodelitschia bisporula TaxID=703511 RepID=A0A6G1IBC9_9PEZI|nr:hypothetical protein EJ06DRAFT_30894 [Trichodelitschia bisporula]